MHVLADAFTSILAITALTGGHFSAGRGLIRSWELSAVAWFSMGLHAVARYERILRDLHAAVIRFA